MAIVKFFPNGDGRHTVEIDGRIVPDVIGFEFKATHETEFVAIATIHVRASADSSVTSDAQVQQPARRPLLATGKA